METEWKEEARKLLIRLRNDNPTFFTTFFPEMFFTKFSELHYRIFKALESKKRCKLILAPRDLGKTSMVKAYAMKKILYGDAHFIVYTSNTAESAIQQTENIKFELSTNKNIIKMFGNVKDEIRNAEAADLDGLGIDPSFSKISWVAFGRTLILPRGIGQQIRGLNWRNYRPDFIILDDPEKKDELYNPDIRKKNLEWFLSDLLQSVDKRRGAWEVLYIDTLKHHDALPMYLKDLPGWEWLRLAICNEKFESLVPELISTDEIAEMMAGLEKIGMLDTFYREYMNLPKADSTASFRVEDLTPYRESELPMHVRDGLFNVVILDPAKSVTQSADYSALCTVGIDLESGKRYIRDTVNKRMYPDETYEAALRLCREYDATVLGVEVTSLNEYILQPLKDYLSSEGADDIQIVELKARGKKKEDRIKSLVPGCRKGLYLFEVGRCEELISQLLDFPYAQFDDLSDALAYVTQLLEVLEIYAEQMPEPDSFEGWMSKLGRHSEEDDYLDLPNEDAVEVPWHLESVGG